MSPSTALRVPTCPGGVSVPSPSSVGSRPRSTTSSASSVSQATRVPSARPSAAMSSKRCCSAGTTTVRPRRSTTASPGAGGGPVKSYRVQGRSVRAVGVVPASSPMAARHARHAGSSAASSGADTSSRGPDPPDHQVRRTPPVSTTNAPSAATACRRSWNTAHRQAPATSRGGPSTTTRDSGGDVVITVRRDVTASTHASSGSSRDRDSAPTPEPHETATASSAPAVSPKRSVAPERTARATAPGLSAA